MKLIGPIYILQDMNHLGVEHSYRFPQCLKQESNHQCTKQQRQQVF